MDEGANEHDVVPAFLSGDIIIEDDESSMGDSDDENEVRTQSSTPPRIPLLPTIVPAVGFVKSKRALVDTMRKMHANNEGVIFDNASGEFKMLIRCSYESDSPEEVEFEVCIIVEEDQTALSKLLKYELDGEFDDDEEDLYIVGSVDIEDVSKIDENDPGVSWFMTTINEVFEWRFCNCSNGFVKRDEIECLRCSLTATDADMDAIAEGTPDCMVCLDPCGRRWVKTMPCCGCKLHSRCFLRWSERNSKCPHCRAASTDSQVVNAVITILN